MTSWRRQTRRGPHDEAWLAAALADPEALLSDHAHCEKKAAATALMLVSRYPERAELVTAMAALAQEELGHFAEVHAALLERGLRFRPDAGDPYAQALVAQVRGQEPGRLVDRLLVSALIEARSCARLRLLARHHPDAGLAGMFGRFATAEAQHGHLFETLAAAAAPGTEDAAVRMEELARFEADLVATLPVRCAMH